VPGSPESCSKSNKSGDFIQLTLFHTIATRMNRISEPCDPRVSFSLILSWPGCFDGRAFFYDCRRLAVPESAPSQFEKIGTRKEREDVVRMLRLIWSARALNACASDSEPARAASLSSSSGRGAFWFIHRVFHSNGY
jgi:hypothetical protein